MSQLLGIPIRLDKDGNVIMTESNQAKEGDLVINMLRQQEKDRLKSEEDKKVSNVFKRGLRSKLNISRARSANTTPFQGQSISANRTEESIEHMKGELATTSAKTTKLNRFKLVLILYELHHVDPLWLNQFNN